jgi:hypothetical protein
MTDQEPESGEEAIDEEGRNPTQQRIDEEADSEESKDTDWSETTHQPHQGEEGQEPI